MMARAALKHRGAPGSWSDRFCTASVLDRKALWEPAAAPLAEPRDRAANAMCCASAWQTAFWSVQAALAGRWTDGWANSPDPATTPLGRFWQSLGRLAYEHAGGGLVLAGPWRLEGQAQMFAAIGLPGHLRFAAKMEIFLSWISDRPAAIAWLERRDGLAFLAH